MESRKSSSRVRRMLWSAVIFLVLIGVAVPNPVAAQLLALDDLFARYPALTLVHILPAPVFLLF